MPRGIMCRMWRWASRSGRWRDRLSVTPSTILRQIRRLETRRDDPLVDDALDLLGQFSRFETHPMQEPAAMNEDRKSVV